jgi:hypothetical protein
MCTGFGPLHLLFFTEAFAHHLLDRGLHKTRGDRFSMVILVCFILLNAWCESTPDD